MQCFQPMLITLRWSNIGLLLLGTVETTFSLAWVFEQCFIHTHGINLSLCVHLETFSVFFFLQTKLIFPSGCYASIDMSTFGHYPGHDDFYLVVCGHCSQVVKPQAFEKHCERRHGSLGKLYAHLRSTPPPPQQQRPRHGHTPPSHGASSWSARNQNVGLPRASPQSPSTPPQFRHSKPPKDGVR